MMCRWVLLVLGLFCLAAGSRGEVEGFSQAVVSDWVKPADLNLDIKNEDHHSQDGMRYILHERQNNWAAEEQYTRNVALLENDSGVQNAGKLDVQFNPAYQELIFHTIRVMRDGQSIDKLDLSNIQVIQSEAELEAHTVTGIKTADVSSSLCAGPGLRDCFCGGRYLVGGLNAGRNGLRSSDGGYRFLGGRILDLHADCSAGKRHISPVKCSHFTILRPKRLGGLSLDGGRGEE